MKIMHFNCSDSGSTGKIIFEIEKQCRKYGYKTVLCVPRIEREIPFKAYQTSLKREQGLYRHLCEFGALRYGFAPLSTEKILKIVKKEKPDIVHLHSANCNMVNLYRLVNYLKKNKIATVITNHAEFFYTGSCPHSYDCNKWKTGCYKCENLFEATLSHKVDRTSTAFRKMKDAFSGFDKLYVVSVSDWIKERSQQSAILGNYDNVTIKNGVDTSVFCKKDGVSIREKHNINEKTKVICHVTASFTDDVNDSKGGYYILKLAEKLKNDDAVIFVAGRISANVKFPENIIYLGEIKNQTELADLYNGADLTVITSKRETYSMPVAESLCSSTPVVGFEAGGPESIALKKYTKFVQYGDVDGLYKAVKEILCCKTSETANDICKDAEKEYCSKRMAEQYVNIYRRMCNER